MNAAASPIDLSTTGVIVPALNEAGNIEVLVPALKTLGVGQIVVSDNGSTDDTARVARRGGADCASAPRRGYGAACFAGIQRLRDDITIVAFMDADMSDPYARLPELVEPILGDRCDLVLGARTASLRDAGSTTRAQNIANVMLPALIRIGWGHRYRDLGPFRAIRRASLDRLHMRDRAFGWTVEMQIRAVEEGLRVMEIEVPYQRRLHGRSKISGTLVGAMRAAYWIIRTCAVLWLTRPLRRRPAP